MTDILDIPADTYHADTDGPSLSASIASILVTRSPLHAWTAHPKLNPAFVRDEDPKFDVGRVAHAVILEGADIVYVVHADTWRTNDAKEARKYARGIGKVPLLAHQLADVQAMVAAVQPQLDAHNALPALFTDGKPEQTLTWDDDGVRCKARLDWLRDDHATIDDLKTTSRSANPDAYSRNLYDVGGDVQAAFYLRGVEKVTGKRPEFRWVIVETAPPYALSVVSPGPDVLALGAAKVDRALETWKRCLDLNEWPGYPVDVCYADMPPWEESRWLERDAREAA